MMLNFLTLLFNRLRGFWWKYVLRERREKPAIYVLTVLESKPPKIWEKHSSPFIDLMINGGMASDVQEISKRLEAQELDPVSLSPEPNLDFGELEAAPKAKAAKPEKKAAAPKPEKQEDKPRSMMRANL